MASVRQRLAGLVGRRAREESTEDNRSDSGVEVASSGSKGRRPQDPERVGAYWILGHIRDGRHGPVYRARHRSERIAQRQGGQVALKLLAPELASDPEVRVRFERQAALGMELDHPGLVQVEDLVLDGDQVAFVMELVEGERLADSLRRRKGGMSWEESWKVLTPLMDTLVHAHERGAVHGALSPACVTQVSGDRIKLSGLGFQGTGAELLSGLDDGEALLYLAPEQHSADTDIDVRADVWSVGVMLYELLVGRLPWDRSLTGDELLRVKTLPEGFALDALPPEMAMPILRSLSPDPRRRFSSVEALQSALETAHFRYVLAEDAQEESGRLEPLEGPSSGMVALFWQEAGGHVGGGLGQDDDGLDSSTSSWEDEDGGGLSLSELVGDQLPDEVLLSTESLGSAEEELEKEEHWTEAETAQVGRRKGPDYGLYAQPTYLQPRSRKPRRLPRIPLKLLWAALWTTGGLAFVGGLLGLAVSLVVVWQLGLATLERREAANEALLAEIAELERQAAELDELKEVSARLEGDLAILAGLEEERGEAFQLLGELSARVPADMWLTSMVELDGNLSLDAVAVESSAIPLLHRRLEASPLLHQVRPMSSDREGMAGLTVFTTAAVLLPPEEVEGAVASPYRRPSPFGYQREPFPESPAP